jgi:hypothetical protein
LSTLRRAWKCSSRWVPRKARQALVRQLKTEELFTHEAARMMTNAFQYVRIQDVPGDYAEFGVYRGRAFVEAWRAARKHGSETQLYAFDSFQGLPPLSGTDRDSIWHARRSSSTR